MNLGYAPLSAIEYLLERYEHHWLRPHDVVTVALVDCPHCRAPAGVNCGIGSPAPWIIHVARRNAWHQLHSVALVL